MEIAAHLTWKIGTSGVLAQWKLGIAHALTQNRQVRERSCVYTGKPPQQTFGIHLFQLAHTASTQAKIEEELIVTETRLRGSQRTDYGPKQRRRDQ
jgi:hypothetical protein